MSDIIHTLQQCRLFTSIDQEILVELAQSLRLTDYAMGESVYRVGDLMSGLFVIAEGAVRFDLGFIEEHAPLVTILHSNKFFGEQDLFDNTRSLATATCVEPSKIILIDRGVFLQWFEQVPLLAQNLARVLAANCRVITQGFCFDLYSSAEARLAKLLLHLHYIESKKTASEQAFIIRYSHNELAEMIGLTRTAISKPLRQWKEKGWIDIKNREIEVFDFRALQACLTT